MRNHNDKLHEDIRVSGKLITESLGKLIRAAGDGLKFDPRRELESAGYHWNQLQRRVREWAQTEEQKAAEAEANAPGLLPSGTKEGTNHE